MKKTKLMIALCFTTYMGFAQFNNIVPVAGTGVARNTYGPGEIQPNNLGLAAPPYLAVNNDIGAPLGVAVDGAGNVYYVDVANNCIMKVTTSGIISWVAGLATPHGGYTDNGLASGATFYSPTFLCLDAAGNLYVSDTKNQIIRMIQKTSGQINSSCPIITVAGVQGSSCLTGGVGTICGDGVPATQAFLDDPQGIAVDIAGSLFINDGSNGYIRKVTNASNPSISVINVLTNGGGYGAGGVAIDPVNGDLYYSSSVGYGSHVFRMAASGGLISIGAPNANFAGNGTGTFGGDGGQAVNASLFNPLGLAVDGQHNVYIADQQNFRIRKVNGSTGIITTVAGNGVGSGLGATGSSNPTGVGIDPFGVATDACGSVYFTDFADMVVAKLADPVTFAPTVSVPTLSVCSGSSINATGTSGSNVSSITPDYYTWSLISTNSSWVGDGGPGATGTISSPGSNNVSFSIPTTGLVCNHNYILQLTATKNCPQLSAATATTHVYINCNPTPVITGNTNICLGGSTSLCQNYPAGAPNSITWSTPLKRGSTYLGSGPCIIESPTANTIYNVTVVNTTTGCSGTASQLVTVSPNNPTFNLTITSNASSFNLSALANDAATTSSAGYGYEYILEELTSLGGSDIWIVNTNPGIWWNFFTSSPPTVFNDIDCTVPGNYTSNPTIPSSGTYPIGKFLYNHIYRVTLGSWNNACSWQQQSITVSPAPPGHRSAEGYPEVLIQEDHTAPDFSYLRDQNATSGLDLNNDVNSALVTVYPNPNNGSFIIETNNIEKQQLNVFDVNGRVVLSQTMSGKTNIDASTLSDGIYNIRITSGNNVINKKLVIVK